MTPHIEENDVQDDLLPGISDVESARYLLADMHDDLRGRIMRIRYLTDLGADLGSEGTMLFGGYTTYTAWFEASSSFIYGNYASTTPLCQALAENLLAASLQGGMMMDDLPPRIQFRETLKRCQIQGLLDDRDCVDLERLMILRNPQPSSEFERFLQP
jgi:hypothetical protein